MNFGDYLDQGMAAAGLKPYGLAKRLGRSVTMMARLASRKRNCGASEDLLRAIAQELNLDGDQVVALSAELYEEGSPRWMSSKRLAEILQLREENQHLREENQRLRKLAGGEAA